MCTTTEFSGRTGVQIKCSKIFVFYKYAKIPWEIDFSQVDFIGGLGLGFITQIWIVFSVEFVKWMVSYLALTDNLECV